MKTITTIAVIALLIFSTQISFADLKVFASSSDQRIDSFKRIYTEAINNNIKLSEMKKSFDSSFKQSMKSTNRAEIVKAQNTLDNLQFVIDTSVLIKKNATALEIASFAFPMICDNNNMKNYAGQLIVRATLFADEISKNQQKLNQIIAASSDEDINTLFRQTNSISLKFIELAKGMANDLNDTHK